MKTSFHARSATCIVALAVINVAASATGQVPSKPQTRPATFIRAEQKFPAPINLKVLPKSLTGRQVHQLMEQWSSELGVRCSACHVTDSEGVLSAANPQPRFADDAKPMKAVARVMYTMTVDSNRKFITGDDGVPGPVTCGMCHRGSIKPPPFVSPRDGEESTTLAGPAHRAATSP